MTRFLARAVLTLVSGLAVGLWLPSGPPPVLHRGPAASMAAPSPVVVGTRSRCRFDRNPWGVAVKGRSTPLVGEELVLEVVTSTGAGPVALRTWIEFGDPGLEALDGAGEWVDELPAGGRAAHALRVRVTSGRPIRVTAKVAPSGGLFPCALPSEHYLTLYPFDLRDGTRHAEWDSATLRPLGDPAPEVVTFADGQKGVLTRIQ